ncbi:hypothetical protein BJ165DRAFT_1501755 [Panaeolus papilionaceus]|nr:hypothetical protein BJ165DRAFT_1501755 [Panaeolus papilionaceus]
MKQREDCRGTIALKNRQKSRKKREAKMKTSTVCPAQIQTSNDVDLKERAKSKSPRKRGGSPDDTSRYCSGKVITSSGCKQSPRNWGGKN